MSCQFLLCRVKASILYEAILLWWHHLHPAVSVATAGKCWHVSVNLLKLNMASRLETRCVNFKTSRPCHFVYPQSICIFIFFFHVTTALHQQSSVTHPSPPPSLLPILDWRPKPIYPGSVCQSTICVIISAPSRISLSGTFVQGFNCSSYSVAVSSQRDAAADLCEVNWMFSKPPSRLVTLICQQPSLLIPHNLPRRRGHSGTKGGKERGGINKL